MSILISGSSGIDMGNLPVSNARQVEVQDNQVSPFGGFKNYIINGNFNVWQRGTSFTGLTNGSYSADRWVVYDSVGDINYNVVRNVGLFTGGYGASYTWNSGTGTKRSIIQFIENVTRFEVGSQVTVSFEAYTDSTPYNLSIALQGVKGIWAAATSTVSQTISLTNTKTKYSVTLVVPDWTSLAIDWAHLEDTKLALKFDMGTETNGRNFVLGKVQLEEGSVATPFENRPYGLELSLCQRYLYKEQPGYTLWGTKSSTSDGFVSWTADFPVPMRIPPTVTFLNEHSWGSASVTTVEVGTTGYHIAYFQGDTTTSLYRSRAIFNAEL